MTDGSPNVRRARRARAIDLLEWERAFGFEPVSKELWAATLLPQVSPVSAYRRWSRMKNYWTRDGVQVELVLDPLDPSRRVRVRITPQAIAWATLALETGDDMLTETTRDDMLIETTRVKDLSGPHAVEVQRAAEGYLAAVERLRAGGPADQILVRELLSLASWYPDLGVPLWRVAEDFWAVTTQLLPSIAKAAKLKIHACSTERWFRRDEAQALLAQFLAERGE